MTLLQEEIGIFFTSDVEIVSLFLCKHHKENTKKSARKKKTPQVIISLGALRSYLSFQ